MRMPTTACPAELMAMDSGAAAGNAPGIDCGAFQAPVAVGRIAARTWFLPAVTGPFHSWKSYARFSSSFCSALRSSEHSSLSPYVYPPQ